MRTWDQIQDEAIAELEDAIAHGETELCLTAPTGGGKTTIVRKFIQRHPDWHQVFYSNRRILTDQSAGVFDTAGVDIGIQAAGYAPTLWAKVQVASIQTVAGRVAAKQMELSPARVVWLDEAHTEKGKRSKDLMAAHRSRGAVTILLTATPLGLKDHAKRLIFAGRTSDLIRCGAIVPAQTFAPSEIDWRAYKPKTRGLLQLKNEVREAMLPTIIGDVLQHWPLYNPESRPTIAYGPGVDECFWFAEKTYSANIPCAAISGERIFINGDWMESTRENRQMLREAAEAGRIKITWNRFVLREGVDWPFLYHAILACKFGSVAPYIQACGRVLRQYFIGGVPQYKEKILQDHGGNYHDHDSVNADRLWELTDTEKSIQDAHDELYQTKARPEPARCPKCHKIRRLQAVACPHCGHVSEASTRRVIETSGKLTEVRGDVFKKVRVNDSPDLHKVWIACVFRARNAGRTFNQAKGTFMRENGGQQPGPNYPMMPKERSDWYLPVADFYPKKTKPTSRTADPQGSLF